MGNRKYIYVAGFIFVLIIGAYFGIKIYAENRIKKELDNNIAKISAFADVTYEKVSFQPIGLTTRIIGVTLSPVNSDMESKIDEIVIYKVDTNNKVPAFLHVLFKGINMDVNRDGAMQVLNDMGYKAIKANLELDYNFDQAEKELFIKKIRIGADDMGDFDLSVHLSNLDDFDSDNLNFLSAVMAVSGITLHKAELSYSDKSMVQKLIRRAAEKNHVSLDAYLTEINADLDRAIATQESELARQIVISVRDFVNKPEKISISVAPKNPIPLGRVSRLSVDELSTQLNLHVNYTR